MILGIYIGIYKRVKQLLFIGTKGIFIVEVRVSINVGVVLRVDRQGIPNEVYQKTMGYVPRGIP